MRVKEKLCGITSCLMRSHTLKILSTALRGIFRDKRVRGLSIVRGMFYGHGYMREAFVSGQLSDAARLCVRTCWAGKGSSCI